MAWFIEVVLLLSQTIIGKIPISKIAWAFLFYNIVKAT